MVIKVEFVQKIIISQPEHKAAFFDGAK